jgi:predicted kinase
MQKLTVLVGVSGSGKSTFASEKARTGNCVIVSRDALRMNLFGYSESTYSDYYNRSKEEIAKSEEIVSKFHNNQIFYAIEKGMDVICDNTHLSKKYINHYKQFGCFIDLHFLHTTHGTELETFIERDRKRIKCVGEDVIKKQFHNYCNLYRSDVVSEIEAFNNHLQEIYRTCKKTKDSKKRCIVFDIDNTLAHKNGRSAYDYSLVGNDEVDESVVLLHDYVQAHSLVDVIICSGREGTKTCISETEKWLRNKDIFYEEIYFRKEGDMRTDYLVKAEMWREIQKEYEIVALIDDRVQVVSFARRLGYKVFECERGDF